MVCSVYGKYIENLKIMNKKNKKIKIMNIKLLINDKMMDLIKPNLKIILKTY